MSVEPGSRIGPYDVTAILGVGGMGEVYRARDSRLGREVAIKILPQGLADDRARMARFEREARIASSLSHANIVTIHDVGRDDGTSYIVMELVPGKTLTEMIRTRPALEKTLAVASQLAEGLAAAHAAGIVHRDLKPGNIMVTPQGTVKILDFGLAKPPALERDGTSQAHTAEILTREHDILGTLPYMSPEQRSGEAIDYHTDQYAFGLILAEMISGHRGAAMPDDVPRPLAWIVDRCLEKEPAKRYASTSDLARDVAMLNTRLAQIEAPAPKRRYPIVTLVALTAAIVAATAAALMWGGRRSASESPSAYVALHVPEVTTLPQLEVSLAMAISPDGGRVAVAGVGHDGKSGLWIRDIKSTTTSYVAGTNGARSPVWSRDGRQIAFLADARLKVVTPGGGPPRVVFESFAGTTLAWTRDGRIVFGHLHPDGPGLFVVSAQGGPVRRLTTVDSSRSEVMNLWPEVSEDDKTVLYIGRSGRMDSTSVSMMLRAVPLAGGTPRDIAPTTSRFLLRNNTAYYVRDGTLFAQRYDLKTFQLRGEAVPVATGFYYFHSTGTAEFSVSDTGTVCLRSAREVSRLFVLNRQGRATLDLGRDVFGQVRVSPDGTSTAVIVMNEATGTSDIWSYDLAGKGPTRLTFESFDERSPVWSPDGRSIYFRSDRLGPPDVMRLDLEGGRISLIVRRSGVQDPTDVAPDGSMLLMNEAAGATALTDVLSVALTDDPRGQQAAPFISSPLNDYDARFSPSGKLFAYCSNRSGATEIYVSRFGATSAAHRASRSGGSRPRWTSGGRELIYRATPTDLMTVTVSEAGERIELSEPRLLLRSTFEIADFDMTPDGNGVIIRTGEEERAPAIQLVLNAPKPKDND